MCSKAEPNQLFLFRLKCFLCLDAEVVAAAIHLGLLVEVNNDISNRNTETSKGNYNFCYINFNFKVKRNFHGINPIKRLNRLSR
jgi:hypothetical protein